MYALEHDELLRRVASLAEKDANASVYCVDSVGGTFVDIPPEVAQYFSWTVSADSPLDLMAPNFRLSGSTLFRMCRHDGSAIGIVRMADRPHDDVELHLFNAGDYVVGVVVDIPKQRESAPADVPQSNVDTQENAIVVAESAAAAAAARSTAESDAQSARHRWEAWESRTDQQLASAGSNGQNDRAVSGSASTDLMRLHTDAAGVISWANDAAVDGLGRNRDALVGSRMSDYVHRDDKVIASMQWSSLLASPHSERKYRATFLRGDGQTVVLDRTDHNRLDSDERVVEVQLRHTNEAVPETQTNFQRQLVSTMSSDPAAAVAFVDANREVSYANSEWTRITRVSQGARIDNLSEKLVSADAFQNGVERVFREGQTADTNVVLRTAPGGGNYNAHAALSRLRGPQGNDGLLVTLSDVSEVVAPIADPRQSRRQPAPPPQAPRKERSATAAAAATATGVAAGAVAAKTVTTDQAEGSKRRFRRDKKADSPASIPPPVYGHDTAELEPVVVPATAWSKKRLALAATVVTALAAFLRFIILDRLPPALSESEALFAIESRDVLDNTALYSLRGFGQPLGPAYVLGLVTRLFGDSIWVLRGTSAVIGILTVLAVFWFARRYGGWAATAAAATLAAMVWHLHYSRLTLGAIWWPLVIVLFLWSISGLFDRELSPDSSGRAMWWRWGVAGVLLGGGVYFANAHWLLLGALPLVSLPWAIFGQKARSRGGFWGWLVMVGFAAVVALPMGLRMFSDGGKILDSFAAVDARTQLDWNNLSFGSQVTELFRWWGQTWVDLLGGNADVTDALGVVAPVNIAILIAAVVGLVVLLIRRQNGTTWMMLAILLVAPFGTALTIDGIGLRHSFAMAPILAILAGVGIGWVADRFGRGANGFWRAGAAAIVLMGVVVGLSVYDYFWRFDGSDLVESVYSTSSDEAMEAINANGAWVNFYSSKQKWEGPRRHWQAPDNQGTDRSREFGTRRFSFDPAPGESPQLFVLLDSYAVPEFVDQLESRYPDARREAGSLDDGYLVFQVEDPQ